MASAATGGAEEQLQFRLSGLEHEVARGEVRVRRLKWVAALLVILLVLVLICLYLYIVLQYAQLVDVRAEPSSQQPGSAAIAYTPRSSGKVEFVRKASDLEETLTDFAVDPIGTGSEKRFEWAGAPNDSYDLQVTYREGLMLKTRVLLASGKPPAS